MLQSRSSKTRWWISDGHDNSQIFIHKMEAEDTDATKEGDDVIKIPRRQA